MKELLITATDSDAAYSAHYSRFEKYVSGYNPANYTSVYSDRFKVCNKHIRVTTTLFILAVICAIVALASQVYNILAQTLKFKELSVADYSWLYAIEILFAVLALVFALLSRSRSRKNFAEVAKINNEMDRNAFEDVQQYFGVPDNFLEIGVLQSQAKKKGSEIVYPGDEAEAVLSKMFIYTKNDAICITDYITERTIPIELLVSSELINRHVRFMAFEPSDVNISELRSYGISNRKHKYQTGSYGKFVFEDENGEFVLKVLPNDYYKVLRLLVPQDAI
ncbi:MAG: hypothetical protein LBE09_03115 [Christensenellaceae bacterium]|jgi:hypothetical protein|nr:hypothetical protein [Christensenellaceae bacterium]